MILARIRLKTRMIVVVTSFLSYSLGQCRNESGAVVLNLSNKREIPQTSAIRHKRRVVPNSSLDSCLGQAEETSFGKSTDTRTRG